MRKLLVVGALLSVGASGACTTDFATERSEAPSGSALATLRTSDDARAVLQAARGAARPSARAEMRRRLDPSSGIRRGSSTAATASLLHRGVADAFVRSGERIHAQSKRFATEGALESSLPAIADGPVKLRAGNIVASLRLRGASASPAEDGGDGFVVYREAIGGAHLLHRPGDTSEEDFLYFGQRPADATIAYDIDLESGIAGVRLVANTIELLDDKGVPRLRMSPPYLVDASGAVEFMKVAVTGCAVDEDPTPSWERTWVKPSSTACTIHARWADEKLAYPIVVDPAWVTTGSMATPRYFHTSTSLNNGRVLVTGGESTFDSFAPLNTAELFDPAYGVWTATASMSSARSLPTSVLLTSGRVLLAGGFNSLGSTSSSELYDPTSGTWIPAGSMATPRAQHTATLLPNQTVIVAGGLFYDAASETITGLASCERYFEITNSWVTTASLSGQRAGHHTSTLLADGRVLTTGGFAYAATGNTGLATAELYDPEAGAWSSTGSMSVARGAPATVLLPTNKVLVAGGTDYPSRGYFASAELFDPATGTWAPTGSMSTTRGDTAATLLVGSNKVLVPGGVTGAGASIVPLASAELYNAITGTWTTTTSMSTPRSSHTATFVGGGVLLAGGSTDYVNVSAGALIYLP